MFEVHFFLAIEVITLPVRLFVANFATHLCFKQGSCRLLARSWRVLVRNPGDAFGNWSPRYDLTLYGILGLYVNMCTVGF